LIGADAKTTPKCKPLTKGDGGLNLVSADIANSPPGIIPVSDPNAACQCTDTTRVFDSVDAEGFNGIAVCSDMTQFCMASKTKKGKTLFWTVSGTSDPGNELPSVVFQVSDCNAGKKKKEQKKKCPVYAIMQCANTNGYLGPFNGAAGLTPLTGKGKTPKKEVPVTCLEAYPNGNGTIAEVGIDQKIKIVAVSCSGCPVLKKEKCVGPATAL